MEIVLDSFSGKDFISKISTTFKEQEDFRYETDDFLILDIPYGFGICSHLTTGLTISYLEFESNSPQVNFKFVGEENQVPYKIGFCIEGEFELNYPSENLRQKIKEQECMIIAPRKNSLLTTQKGKKITYLYIFITKGFLETYFNIDTKNLNDAITKISNSDFIFAKSNITPQMQLAIQDISNTREPDMLSKLLLESKTLELLSLFLQQFSRAETSISKSDKDTILSIHKYILDNISENITIDGLLKMFGSNENKLQAGFKTLFGTTIKKHIKRLRMQKARDLILNDNLLVSEAGYEVGYSNISHFTTAFRQEYGILPGNLKKNSNE